MERIRGMGCDDNVGNVDGEDKKEWERVRRRLPKRYEWRVQYAKKKNKKRRALEGMIMGIRRGMVEKGMRIESDGEGVMVGKLREKKERWRIVGVYVR